MVSCLPASPLSPCLPLHLCRTLLPRSPQELVVLGLDLMRLLVQNRIAEFHTDLELIAPEVWTVWGMVGLGWGGGTPLLSLHVSQQRKCNRSSLRTT